MKCAQPHPLLVGVVQVLEMLEQAGFSRHNPYNIVQQGKIARMSQLSDSERLGMLKEIGGASVYENKRKESDRRMEAQQQQMKDVDEAVCHNGLHWTPSRGVSAC
jgi:structural maintenance of chromosome 3 (chondroitin sulfate proteoglycan 6)